jgi:hypothetical protein
VGGRHVGVGGGGHISFRAWTLTPLPPPSLSYGQQGFYCNGDDGYGYLLVTRSFMYKDNRDYVKNNNGKMNLASSGTFNDLLAYISQTYVPSPAPTMWPSM